MSAGRTWIEVRRGGNGNDAHELLWWGWVGAVPQPGDLFNLTGQIVDPCLLVDAVVWQPLDKRSVDPDNGPALVKVKKSSGLHARVYVVPRP